MYVTQHKRYTTARSAPSVLNGQLYGVHASSDNVTTFQIYGLLTCQMQVST